MYTSLANFINDLEQKGELIRIKEFCDPKYIITEITDRESKKPDGGKALLFENNGTAFPVITNMLGSRNRMLMALGAESYNEISHKIDTLLNEVTKERYGLKSKLGILPTLGTLSKWLPKLHKGIPDCQEVVQYKPDLSRLPILTCWPQDGGPFITLPLVNTKDPVSGVRNVGMYRMQVFSNDTTGMHWHKHKTGARHFDEFVGDKMPVAVCLGGDPVYTYAATAPLPDGIDEYLLAGFLRGKGVQLAKCLTQDILVPADCDFVLEGYVSKKEEKVVEGPFGDHTGFYSLEDNYPKFHITCITHKKGAVYPATVVGVPPQEDKYFAEATEHIFLSPIKFALAPEILDLHLPEEGVGHNFCIVKIKKRYAGQAIKIAHSLWGAGQMMFNKMMIIVDESVPDIRNRESLEQCILKNYSPVKDTFFSRGPLDVLDHTSPVCGFGGKVCIDATIKYPDESFSKNGGQQGIPNGTAAQKFISFVHKGEPLPSDSLVVGVVDDDVDLADNYRCLWLLGGNTDAIRDASLKGNQLVFDACSKKNDPSFTRRWPDIVESLQQTKDFVDKMNL